MSDLLKLCEFIGEATNGPLYIIDFLLRKTKDRRTFLFTLPKIYFHKVTKKQFKKFPKMYFHKFTNLPKSLGPRCLQSERGRNIWGVCILFQNKANTWNLLFQNSSNVEIFPFQNTSRILYSNTKYSSWWNLMLTAQIHIYVLRCSNTSYIKQPWVTFALHLTLKLDKIEQCFVFLSWSMKNGQMVRRLPKFMLF